MIDEFDAHEYEGIGYIEIRFEYGLSALNSHIKMRYDLTVMRDNEEGWIDWAKNKLKPAIYKNFNKFSSSINKIIELDKRAKFDKDNIGINICIHGIYNYYTLRTYYDEIKTIDKSMLEFIDRVYHTKRIPGEICDD